MSLLSRARRSNADEDGASGSTEPRLASQGAAPVLEGSSTSQPRTDLGAMKALWIAASVLLILGLLIDLGSTRGAADATSGVRLGGAASALVALVALVGAGTLAGAGLGMWQLVGAGAMGMRALWLGLSSVSASAKVSPMLNALAVLSFALELGAVLLFVTRSRASATSKLADRALALWDGLAVGLGAGALLWWAWRVPLMMSSAPAGKPASGVGLPGLLAFSLSAGAVALLAGHLLQDHLNAREEGKKPGWQLWAASTLALAGALGLCLAQARWLSAGTRGAIGSSDALLACLSPLALAAGMLLLHLHSRLQGEEARAPWANEDAPGVPDLGTWALGLSCIVALLMAWRLSHSATRAVILGSLPQALWWAPVLATSAAARLAWPRRGASAGSRESRREIAALKDVVARRTHQLATLHSMTADLSDTLSCERILTTAVERALLALDARCAAVWLNIDASELSLDDRPSNGDSQNTVAGLVRTVPVALFVWREMERTGTERRALDNLRFDDDLLSSPERRTQKIGGSGGALGGVAVADKQWSMTLARGHENESARRVLSQMHRLLEFNGLERFASLERGEASAFDIHPRDVGLRTITVQAPVESAAGPHAPQLRAGVSKSKAAATDSDSLLREMRQVLGHAHIAPIRSKGDLLGALGAWRPGAKLDEAERSLVAALALEVGAVMQNVQLYQETSRLADRDSLTDLLNHRAIQSQLNAILARTQRAEGSFAVIMMDLNNFKYFNDTYGHPEGDRVLRIVARCLREACRGGDIVGRFGGDEFIALLIDTDAEGALQACQRIADRVQEEGYQQRGDARRIPITLSFGAALFPQDGATALDLLTVADSQLYEAKRGGGEINIRKQSSDEEELNKLKQAGTGGSFGVLDALVTAIDNKDHYTRRHSEDVTHWASMMARQLSFSAETQRAVRIAGLLHDVGKIAVPDSILRKPGRLNDDEFQIMQQHPVFGALIVKDVPNLPEVLGGIRHHHERFDGKGYPDKLKGEGIPLLGRLLAVPDCFSAMTTDRPYRKALTWTEAMDEIEKGKGTQFDPTMADAFLEVMARLISGAPEEPEDTTDMTQDTAAEAVVRTMADPDAKSVAPAQDSPQYLPRSVADAKR